MPARMMGLSLGQLANLTTFTWATKPSTPPVGVHFFLSDVGTKGSFWYYDGTRWKPVNNQACLATLDTASSGINASETIVFQYQMPATLLQSKDRLRLYASGTRTGSTNAMTLRVRIGTAGTTGDTALFNGQLLSTSQLNGGVIIDWRLESATSMQVLSRNDLGYGGGTTNASSAATTISNVSNSLFFSVGILGGATDAAVLADAQLWHLVPAN